MTGLHGAAGAALAGLLAAVAQPAAAVTATFDFVAIADGAAFWATDGASDDAPYVPRAGFEGNWNAVDGIDGAIGPVVGDGAGIVDLASGIIVRARGLSLSGTADAFFDSSSFGPRPAGLGVCSLSLSVSCKTGVAGANTGDDNLNRAEESLLFTFNMPVQVKALTIINALHHPANGTFTVDDVSYDIIDGAVDAAFLALIAPRSSYTLKYMPDGEELYVGDFTVAPVPLPAGALLLGSALAGLGFAGRRGAARGRRPGRPG